MSSDISSGSATAKAGNIRAATLYIPSLETGLERHKAPSRASGRGFASLVGDAAFAGELTRGNSATIPATPGNKNMQRYQESVWLTTQSDANRSQGPIPC